MVYFILREFSIKNIDKNCHGRLTTDELYGPNLKSLCCQPQFEQLQWQGCWRIKFKVS